MTRNIAIIDGPQYIDQTLSSLKEENGEFKIICMTPEVYEIVQEKVENIPLVYGFECVDVVLYKKYLPDFDVEEKAIKWLKSISKHKWSGNSTVKELFEYEGVSLWWFMEPWIYTSYVYHHSVRDITQSIELMRSILDKEKPKKVMVAGNEVLMVKVLRKLCKKKKIRFVYHPAPALSALRYRLGRKLRPLYIAKMKQGRKFMRRFLWQVLRVFHGEKHHPPNKRRIFLFAGSSWQTVFDIPTSKSIMGEAFWHDTIKELNKDKKNGVYVIDYVTRYDTKFQKLEDTIKYKHVAYRPLERYVTLSVMLRASKLKNRFNTQWKQVRDTPAVRKTFVYDGIDVYDLIRPQLDYFFSMYCQEKIEHIETIRNLIRHESPDVLVLDSGVSLFGLAVIYAGKLTGVPTVDIQNAALRESDPILVHYPEEIANHPNNKIRIEDTEETYWQDPSVTVVKNKIKRLETLSKVEKQRAMVNIIDLIDYKLLNAETMSLADVKTLEKLQDKLIKKMHRWVQLDDM